MASPKRQSTGNRKQGRQPDALPAVPIGGLCFDVMLEMLLYQGLIDMPELRSVQVIRQDAECDGPAEADANTEWIN